MNPVLNEDNVHFHIVGKGIKKSIRQSLSGYTCLTIHGFLSTEELKSLLLTVDFLFVPINLGGGTKLKIIEALSCGLPSFSTIKGVEGMNLVPMIHYIPFNNVEDFLALLSISESKYKELRKSCFDVFNSQFALS
jgi:glycosyltransferase involved in cell wall biosynthesis